ncbi:MAG: hypothetical protein NZ522_01380 [Chitinophagales bacterium]|nr:hypothetical protein [Chitinophagales bacterium]
MPAGEQYVYRVVGRKSYELKDHLGNVTVVVSDAKEAATSGSTITGYHAYTESYTHYYPFGMAMPGRSYNSGEYRYGFGGHEKIDEVSGSGNTVDMGDRWLDVRLGRTSSTDAKAEKYPFVSPYAFAINNPINAVDPDGKDVYLIIWKSKQGETGHAAIAVDNYKKVEIKVIENGKEVTKTEWVKDGTVTVYDLWPEKPVRMTELQHDVKDDYNKRVVNVSDLINKDVSASGESGKVSEFGEGKSCGWCGTDNF